MVSNYLLVAAIDFGTTYSGFAFSFRYEFERDPKIVSARTWTAASGGLQSHKTATCILFEPTGKFHSFGFEAEDKYLDLAGEKNHHGWYFFKRFKMQLFETKNVNQTFHLKSENGNSLPAIKVFTESIKYLKNELLNDCMNQNADIDINDIKWVLTVPSIWSDPAKSFMRAAAEKVSMTICIRWYSWAPLVIALEPEAAAMFLRRCPFTNNKKDRFSTLEPGLKYLVLDAGGGTVDIAVHEVRDDGAVKEIMAANGGHWGGTKVDKAFHRFLKKIFGKAVIKEFRDVAKYDFLEIFRDFEVKKRSINSKMDIKLTIRIPAALNEIFTSHNPNKSLEDHAAHYKFADNITFSRDKLRIEPVVAISLFDKSIQASIKHLARILTERHAKDVKYIFMVGGFSESTLLVEQVKLVAAGKDFIVPAEAELVILKGAVIFGHDPSTIVERISRHTYGLACSREFDPSVHTMKKSFVRKDGKRQCNDIFNIHVQRNQGVTIGEYQSTVSYRLLDHGDGLFSFPVYSSTEENPMYTTDTSCQKLGELIINLPYEDIYFKEDEIKIDFCFSGTEIEVKAIYSRTGEIFLKRIEIV